jgi:hypothetical protein
MPRHLLIIGASSNLGKLLLLDADSGEVRLGSAQDRMPAAPPGPDPDAQDGCLRWMEEWARRVAAGWYEVDDVGVAPRRARGIVLFPVVEPLMATAVTRGLQVRMC